MNNNINFLIIKLPENEQPDAGTGAIRAVPLDVLAKINLSFELQSPDTIVKTSVTDTELVNITPEPPVLLISKLLTEKVFVPLTV